MFLPPALRPANLLGPYEAWMFGPGKTYDLPGLLLDDLTSLSAVAEITDGLHPKDLPGRFPARQPGRFVDVKVPKLCDLGDFIPRFVPFLIIPADDKGALRAQDEKGVRDILSPFIANRSKEEGSLAHFRLNFPVRAETVDHGDPKPHPPDVPDPTINPNPDIPLVIMGIIDHGIPFAHGAFRGAGGGTRVDFCWSQTAATDRSGAVLFGREFTRSAIDAMVEDHAGDEDAIYRAAGLTSRPGQPPMPLDRMHSHGAHVLDAMAGDWDPDTAAQARIIAVDLPASSVWETSGFGKDMFVLAGLHYIMDRAARIAKSLGRADAPLVINLSYGHSGGPHDGAGLLEAAMDELVVQRRLKTPTAMVMPSGNMFQDRLHARIDERHLKARPDGTRIAELQWFAPPDDRTSSFCEIWLPAEATGANIRVDVIPPGDKIPANGGTMFEVDLAMHLTDVRVGGKIVGQYSEDLYREHRGRIMVALAPTDPVALPGPDHAAAPAGRWTLRVVLPVGVTLGGGSIAARIQRDTSYGQGNTGAKQGVFVDPVDVPYGPRGAQADDDTAGAMLCRFGSINGMATSDRTLVVAGHIDATRTAARYSSAGSALAPPGRQVDCSAPVERSPVLPGVVGAGTRTGISVALRGTSSAAPQAARALAVALLKNETPGDDSYLSLLRALLTNMATVPGDPDPRLGFLLLPGPPGG